MLIGNGTNEHIVGIGTTSPQFHIDVHGRIGIDSKPALDITNFGLSAPSYKVLMLGTCQTCANQTISFNYDPKYNTAGGFVGNGNQLLFRNHAEFMQPNSTDDAWLFPLTISDGYVGIGTRTPTEQLEVDGTALVTDLEVTDDATVDGTADVGEITGPWDNSVDGEDEGFIRLGDVQIVWGTYVAYIQSGENEVDGYKVVFPEDPNNTGNPIKFYVDDEETDAPSYSVTATVVATVEKVRVATIVKMDHDGFYVRHFKQIRTLNDGNPNNDDDDKLLVSAQTTGKYIAIGRWR